MISEKNPVVPVNEPLKYNVVPVNPPDACKLLNLPVVPDIVLAFRLLKTPVLPVTVRAEILLVFIVLKYPVVPVTEPPTYKFVPVNPVGPDAMICVVPIIDSAVNDIFV